MILTIDEVKTHLRIQHDEEDKLISTLIAQAQVRIRRTAHGSNPQPQPVPVHSGWR